MIINDAICLNYHHHKAKMSSRSAFVPTPRKRQSQPNSSRLNEASAKKKKLFSQQIDLSGFRMEIPGTIELYSDFFSSLAAEKRSRIGHVAASGWAFAFCGSSKIYLWQLDVSFFGRAMVCVPIRLQSSWFYILNIGTPFQGVSN